MQDLVKQINENTAELPLEAQRLVLMQVKAMVFTRQCLEKEQKSKELCSF